MADHLIVGSGPLLTPDGRLREPGYALTPPFTYDHAAIKAPAWRIKDWDYYLIGDDRRALALTVSDLGYVGLVSASVLDFEGRGYHTQTELVVAPLGSMGLPADSRDGDLVWSNRRCQVAFRHVGAGRRLSFSMRRFADGRDLEAELLLGPEPRDSMVIATPWETNEHAFYYNRKVYGMSARGAFRVGTDVTDFDEGALALLDWGRGVWTYENVWYWAAAQGMQQGHLVALNLGYGFGDTSAATENMVFMDGIAHKLHQVDFGIPTHADGTYDYLSPWHMTDDEERLDLFFTPEIDRVDDIDIAGIIRSEQHQVFGKLNGHVVLDSGETVAIVDMRGSSEHIHNRY